MERIADLVFLYLKILIAAVISVLIVKTLSTFFLPNRFPKFKPICGQANRSSLIIVLRCNTGYDKEDFTCVGKE